jgi:hypothetical protein
MHPSVPIRALDRARSAHAEAMNAPSARENPAHCHYPHVRGDIRRAKAWADAFDFPLLCLK